MYVCTCEHNVYRGQKKVFGGLELELQVTASHQLWVLLGTEHWMGGPTALLIAKPSLQSHLSIPLTAKLKHEEHREVTEPVTGPEPFTFQLQRSGTRPFWQQGVWINSVGDGVEGGESQSSAGRPEGFAQRILEPPQSKNPGALVLHSAWLDRGCGVGPAHMMESSNYPHVPLGRRGYRLLLSGAQFWAQFGLWQ